MMHGACRGHGLITLEPVQRGRSLIRLPRELIMTAETARAAGYGKEVAAALAQAPTPVQGEDAPSSPAGAGAAGGAAGLTEWQTLIAHLLMERARGDASPWAPYIASLPDQSCHPLMWREEQMAWLEGSPMQVPHAQISVLLGLVCTLSWSLDFVGDPLGPKTVPL